MTTLTTVPLSALHIDKANVRKIGAGGFKDRYASIKAGGILVPLLARRNGSDKTALVIDGGQRLTVLQKLAAEGHIMPDHPVPVSMQSADDSQAREISLASNVIRHAMHPVDEFRAFAALAHAGATPEEIASRFGLGRKQVEQRLALGALAEPIVDAWKDGKLDADAAKAFTLCPNKKVQVVIFNKLAKSGDLYAGAIKHALKIGQDNAGRLLNVVGAEAYEKRGGKITRDLFGSDHIVSDPALLKAMIEESLAAVCKALTDNSWAWVRTDRPENAFNYGRLEAKGANRAQQKKLDDLRRRYDDLLDEGHDEDSAEVIAVDAAVSALEDVIARNAYTAEQRAKAGCFVGLNHRGDAIEIDYGRIEPAAAKPEKKAKAQPKGPAKLSKALMDRLREQRERAIKNAIVMAAEQRCGDVLGGTLARIVAAQIQPGKWGMPSEVSAKLDTIADAIPAKIMNSALRKAFDAADYFAGAPKSFTIAAISEAVSADQARKLAGKKRSEIAKFATVNLVKTGWLPKLMRAAHYDGPKAKAAKAKK